MEKRHRTTVRMNMSKAIKEDVLRKLRAREGKTRMLDDLCED